MEKVGIHSPIPLECILTCLHAAYLQLFDSYTCLKLYFYAYHLKDIQHAVQVLCKPQSKTYMSNRYVYKTTQIMIPRNTI